jgi:hypothetical protein
MVVLAHFAQPSCLTSYYNIILAISVSQTHTFVHHLPRRNVLPTYAPILKCFNESALGLDMHTYRNDQTRVTKVHQIIIVYIDKGKSVYIGRTCTHQPRMFFGGEGL